MGQRDGGEDPGGQPDPGDSGRVSGRVRQALTRAPERVVAAYLFGSTARGTAGPRSDVDVGVLLRGEAPRTLAELPVDLEARLEQVVGRRVQVVVLNDAPCDLVHRVLRDEAGARSRSLG